jgi:hypothetical protein
MNFLQYSAFSPIELKTIEPIEIARIAANFISDVVSPSKGVLMTYELLDIAAAAKASLETKGSYIDGITSYEMHQDSLKNVSDTFQILRDLQLPCDESGKLLPIPFDKAMGILFPNLRKLNRMTEFKSWIKATYKLDLIVSGTKISQYQDQGIPPHIFQKCVISVNQWREENKRQLRTAAGVMGQVAKKRKAKKSTSNKSRAKAALVKKDI